LMGAKLLIFCRDDYVCLRNACLSIYINSFFETY
jgi:hypothetical protein